jgi:myo-inositol-1-phosphate synthase
MSKDQSNRAQIGLWIVGARGGVAVTMIAGLAAKRAGLADDAGLVSQLPQLAAARLPTWDQWVVGGHDIRTAPLADELARLHRESRVLTPELLTAAAPLLADIETRIRPGVLRMVGPRIQELADGPAVDAARRDQTGRDAVARIQADLAAFRAAQSLDRVVVLNLASTEPAPLDSAALPATWADTEQALSRADCPFPASTLYAIAALELGMPYVNFTPSLGAATPAVDELARQRGVCHAGRDAKTGETLLKSVLAPMFAARNLPVMSWVGHNIFGNLDGRVLDDPRNKSAKLATKDRVLSEVLGYAPQTVISIEHVASMGDWKTAWDHVHFRGFLGTPMTLQFTWQGCDSLLAAPLALDLIRLVARAQERGESGALGFLASFFKSPLGRAPAAFADQFRELETWAAAASM